LNLDGSYIFSKYLKYNEVIVVNDIILETKELTRYYGQHACVNKVNLSIKRGEIYGFLGPNGAGKTTTIRMLLGLIKPTSGEIRIFGKDLIDDRLTILKSIGSLVESPSYYGHLTAYENLKTIQRVFDVPKKRIDEVLEVVRLRHVSNQLVKEYSLGMKQRLGIATALLSHPKLLILDEPTNGLDPAGIQEIRDLIKELPKKYGMTVLVSSHLLSEIEQIATQVGIILKGELIFQDSIEAIKKKNRPKLKMGTLQLEQAYQVLYKNGWKPIIENNFIWLSTIDPERIALANEQLVKEGVSIYKLEEVHPSLEDIFLELTGKGHSL
jgi:ABC-2 type transport system ATP-binding protein